MPKLRYFLLAAIALVGLIGTVGCGMYHQDLQSLADFSAAYQQFDQRVSDFSGQATDANEQAADKALADLALRASMRVSSLMKNDGSIMRVASEISDDSEKELGALKASRTVNKQVEDARTARRAAYAHFQRLLEAPPNSE